jgi:uncharacterized protein YjbI with pentapeptide repeats
MKSKTISVALFKVLVDGRACHGGTLQYQPRKWTPKIADLECCSKGYHLTSDPLVWWTPKADLWLAEGREPINGDGSDKAAFASIRLIKKIGWDWPPLSMYPRVRAFLAASDRSRDKNANLSRANLFGASLFGARLSGVNLTGVNLSRANLSGAELYGANLTGADLSRAILSSANLSCADLSCANLSCAILTRAILSCANLTGANLFGAVLTGANLSGAILTGADLTRANLFGASLSGANLSGAELSGANLSGAELYGAYRPEKPPAGWKIVNNLLVPV